MRFVLTVRLINQHAAIQVNAEDPELISDLVPDTVAQVLTANSERVSRRDSLC